jgi:LCP family protein required for cell wall assembly
MGYNHSLTDTILVVSVDTVAKSVVMVSVPRDTARFPLPNGGIYGDKINSLATYADQNKDRYPRGGLAALADAVGYYIGIPINYIAYINLAGFKELIDTVGGVDVNVERAIDDPVYEFPDGVVGFHISAGPHHLNGRLALAYARSRYGLGDSDFTRARRQQQILLALRAKLTSPSVLPDLPHVINSVADVIATNFPPDRLGELLTLSHEISSADIKQFVLGPPYAHSTMATGVYLLLPNMQAIAKWSVDTFGQLSRYDRPG